MTESLQEPALFVGDLEDINLSLPPASGEDYIKRVVLEAQQCDDIVVAEIDRARLRKPTIDINPFSDCIEAPDTLGPAIEWQQCQIVDFSEIRLYIRELKDMIKELKHNNSPKIVLPNKDDQVGWINLCSGISDEETQLFRPTLNIVLYLSQPLIEQILEYLVEYIVQIGKIENRLGEWIFALLVVLEQPLNPDACSCLRSLARACSIIRANSKNLEMQQIASLNLFICLVARYFRQLDLADI
ncbi:gem-associated protein 2-like isoform X1 [Prorops nasuta]|uniref:gem-associated protein 2-like isoform X1 n=1 Tax=Prorops nasuta TaxID=863751 RepID=UPI0034CFD2BC